MKNWKSTLTGAALAAADLLLANLQDPDFDWSDWKHYIRPVLYTVLGYVIADAKKQQTP